MTSPTQVPVLSPANVGVLNDRAKHMSENDLKDLQRTLGFRIQPNGDPVAIVESLYTRLKDESRWTQGSWVCRTDKPCTDQYCFMGHILDVMWGTVDECPPRDVYDETTRKYLQEVYQGIKRHADAIVKRLTDGEYTEVIPFNDGDATTHAEVLTVAKWLLNDLQRWNPDKYMHNYQAIIRDARLIAGIDKPEELTESGIAVGTRVDVTGNDEFYHSLKVGTVGEVVLHDDEDPESYFVVYKDGYGDNARLVVTVKVKGRDEYDEYDVTQWVALQNLRVATDGANAVENADAEPAF